MAYCYLSIQALQSCTGLDESLFLYLNDRYAFPHFNPHLAHQSQTLAYLLPPSCSFDRSKQPSISSMLYQEFYPKWNSYWKRQLIPNCSKQLGLYQNSSTTSNAACIDTALCMIDNSVKNIETQTASTGVLLGLLPTILSILESSPVELGLLGTSRPVLSLLLTLAAPVVNPIRLFDCINPMDTLKNSEEGLKITSKRRGASTLIAASQLVLAIAAVVNVTTVAVDLYGKAWSVVLACKYRWMIFLWNYLVAALWLGGYLSLLSRSRFEPVRGGPATATRSNTSCTVRILDWVKQWPRNELSICGRQEDQYFYWDRENKRYVFFSQVLTLGAVAHIFYGTAIFSGYQFIAPTDAVGIMARYIASAWISRLILTYELAGLSEQTIIQP
jgi:hypothetical protein